jgi:hypothetical protein
VSTLRALALLLVVLALAGCATPYRPKDGSRFGYSETLLAPDVVEVFFDGNSETPAEHASDFVLLRCAEYALENGYSHFVFLERVSDVETNLVSTPLPRATVGATYGTYHAPYTMAATGATRAYYSPHAFARIRLTKAAEEGALDAAFLLRSIRTKYGMP